MSKKMGGVLQFLGTFMVGVLSWDNGVLVWGLSMVGVAAVMIGTLMQDEE